MALLAPLFMAVLTAAPATAQEPVNCSMISDGADNENTVDRLFVIDELFGVGTITDLGAMTTTNAEAFAIRPGFGGYAWDDTDGLVNVDLSDGTTTDAEFDVPGPKVEGLTWANVDNVDSADDVLYIIRESGNVEGYTATGGDAMLDVDVGAGAYTFGYDIAYDASVEPPVLYAIRATAAEATQLVTVDANGATLVGDSAVDLEGLGVTPDGDLIGTTGSGGATPDNLYGINKTTGAAGLIDSLGASVDTEAIDCISPFLNTVTAEAAGSCVNGDEGVITVTVTHTSGDPVAYDVVVTPDGSSIGAGNVSAAEPVATATTVGDLANGDYTVSVTGDGEPVGVADSAITIDCVAPFATLSAQAAFDQCIDDNAGTVDFDITYVDGNVDGTYTIAWSNNGVDSSVPGTIAAGTERNSVPLNNGDNDVTITNTTAGGTTIILDETITVDCAPPVPGEISAVAVASCADNTGTITITIDHIAGEAPVSYRVEATGQNNTVGSIAETDPAADLAYTGLADGDYTIVAFDTVADPEAQVLTETITIVCDGEAPYALAAVVCSDDSTGGVIEFTLTNPTPMAADFVLSVQGQADLPVMGVSANSIALTAVAGLADGTYDVAASTEVAGVPDTEVYSAALNADCSPDPIVAIVSIDCNGPMANGIDRVVTISLDNTAVETATDFVVTFDSAMTTYTVAAGATLSVTLDPVDPGAYPLTIATETGIQLLSEVADIAQQCLTADPAGFCSIFNSTEGKVRIEFDNTGTEARTAEVFVQNSDGILRTTPPQQGVPTIYEIDPDFLTNITLDRVFADGAYEIYVVVGDVLIAAEEVVLTCQNPVVVSTPSAEIGEVDCATETIPVTLTTTGGNTSVLFEVTVDGAVLVIANVTPSTLTVNANSSETVTVGPLADTPQGSPGYDIAVTADGVTLDSATLVVDCNSPGSPQGDVSLAACNAGGFIDVTLEIVGGGAPEDFVVSLNDNTFPTVTVDGSSSQTLEFGPLPEGPVTVTITVDGADVPGSPETVIIDCASALSIVVCDAANIGSIVNTLTNDTAGPIDFTTTVAELDPASVDTTVAAGGTGTDDRTPVADGTYTVTIAEDGVEVSTQVLEVDCEMFGTTEVTLGDVTCAAGGSFQIDLEVMGGTVDQDFTVSVDDVDEPQQPITVAPDASVSTMVGPLPDGTYQVKVTVDGSAVLDEAVPVACAEVTITPTCVDGAGQLAFLYANNTPAQVIFSTTTVGDVTDNAGAAVAVGAESTVLTTTPLPDGSYVVTTTTDGVESDVSTVEVDCLASATLSDDCLSGNGVIRVTVDNSTTSAVQAVVNITDTTAQVVSIPAGDVVVIPRSGRPDGSYEVTVAIDGVVVLEQTVLVDCNSPEPGGGQPAGPETMQVVSCLADNGRIDTNFVNTGDAPAAYRVEFEGLSARQITVDPGDWGRIPITGRPDGTYAVTILRDGMILSSEMVTVSCDTAPPVVDTDEVRVVNSCRAGNGYLLFQFVNDSAAQKGYVIEFQGVPNRSTSAAAFGQAVRAVTGRPDGTYAVSIRSGGSVIETLTVTVDCDA